MNWQWAVPCIFVMLLDVGLVLFVVLPGSRAERELCKTELDFWRMLFVGIAFVLAVSVGIIWPELQFLVTATLTATLTISFAVVLGLEERDYPLRG